MGGPTQAALYSKMDLELSWSEEQLPQVERTKHVHGLHPYLGKFIPQLVEVFLRRYFNRGGIVFDPFVGSGTTLVEAKATGMVGIGSDISAFNCLLTRVKTSQYSLGRLEMALRGAYESSRRTTSDVDSSDVSLWLRTWYSERALRELIAYRAAADSLGSEERDVAHVVLSRAARSARLTRHFDLDFPRKPVRGSYYCHKHARTCAPVDEAAKFLRRYTADTSARLRAFANVGSLAASHIFHHDARVVRLPLKPNGIVTSPPYPGLIDYHEQHRYAYELLGLEDRGDFELGRAKRGTSKLAIEEYVKGMVDVFANAADQMDAGAPVVIVVNDSRDLYPEVLRRAGLRLEQRFTRHVNRRTGRRAGQFFEDVLVCRVGE